MVLPRTEQLSQLRAVLNMSPLASAALLFALLSVSFISYCLVLCTFPMFAFHLMRRFIEACSYLPRQFYFPLIWHLPPFSHQHWHSPCFVLTMKTACCGLRGKAGRHPQPSFVFGLRRRRRRPRHPGGGRSPVARVGG